MSYFDAAAEAETGRKEIEKAIMLEIAQWKKIIERKKNFKGE